MFLVPELGDGSQFVHGPGELVDACAMRFNRMCRAGRLGNLILADVHPDIFEQHLDHSRAAVIFGDLLNPS